MKRILGFTLLIGMLMAANAWGVPFKDDFNRSNGAVGNGWTILTNGTVTSTIVNNEVLVSGTEATDWARCGIQRVVVGETRVSCDAKWDDAFNFHIQIAAQGSNAYVEAYTWPGGALQHANSVDGGWPGWVAFNGANAQTNAGQYNHIEMEVTPGKVSVYLNGKLVETLNNAGFTSTIRQVTIASDAAAATKGSIHIDNVVIGKFVAGKGKDPSPADAGTNVARDATLSWGAGEFAATHNVYFGSTFADVNAADASKAVSVGQTGTTYKMTAPLEYGKTYFWRVDEVNAAPSNTVFKGDVWSFTVEPYAYQITSITATASSSEKSTTGPANMVNGSGVTNSLHGVDPLTMWDSAFTDPGPVWVQFQFDKAYKLFELWVWNYNVEFEQVLGYGIKDVTIETSLDGKTWTLFKDTKFAQATAVAGYAHNTTLDMGGLMAQYVKFTAKSNYSLVGLKQYGLAEVRFYYVPVQASLPVPATNAAGVSLNPALDWRPGRDVTSQKVYLGTDKTAVTNGTATANTVADHGFAPAALNYGTTYFWKVDEIGTATYPGSVWNFTTLEYAVVDDFESYTDKTGSAIYDTWLDGLGGNGTGSQVGYINAPFAETTVIHGGKQSMPLEYNNVKAPFYSETARAFDPTRDWTGGGATTLRLFFRGRGVAFMDNGNNAYTMSASGTDIWNNGDQFRFAYKTLTGDGSLVARVDSLANTNAWAKAGVMIRQSVDAGSTHAFMPITAGGSGAGNGASFQGRLTANGASNNQDKAAPAIAAPYWVKVERKGNSFTGSLSADGKTWTQLGTAQTITMTGPVLIGLALTSHDAALTTTAAFSNVATTGTVSGAWQIAAIGTAMGTNGAAPLYLTVEDKAGKKKTVVNPDAAAVNKAAWTEWKIALSDLSGVNLAAVKKLTIGVGDPAKAQAGATGLLFIDDIGVGKTGSVLNLAVNGGFETGAATPWGSWGGGGQTVTATVVTDCTGATVPEGPIEGKYCWNLKVSGASTNFWDCAFNSAPLPAFEQGTKYTLSAFFKVKSGTGRVNMKPEHSAPNWEPYGEKQVTVTDKWAEYYATTPVFATTVSPLSLTFHIGFQAQELWVDNIKFYVGDYVPSN